MILDNPGGLLVLSQGSSQREAEADFTDTQRRRHVEDRDEYGEGFKYAGLGNWNDGAASQGMAAASGS